MVVTRNLAPPNWSSADDASLELILSLLRDDVSQVASVSKGKQVAGTLSDAQIALQLYSQELDQASVFASDRRMINSMQHAVHADTNVILESQRLEREAENDRRVAMALVGEQVDRMDSTGKAINIGRSATDFELTEKLRTACNIGYDRDDDIYAQPESSSWAASRKSRPSQRQPCSVCSEDTSPANMARAPCGHDYCRECLQLLFRNAISDESLFPPRCCRQAIPADENRVLLSSDLFQEFNKKAVEFSTPNRIYCHQPSCSAFIPPIMIRNGVARCSACLANTCTTCKGNSHRGDCPFDKDLQRVLQVARQEGWQRCRNCSTMVELNTGCFHITCKCRAEFCYLCGATWKTCTCAQWEEARLYNRAEEVYNRDHDPDDVLIVGAVGRQHDAVRQQYIERIMDNLRDNHECTHDRWRSRMGRHECEECGDVLRHFIYECSQCSLLACRRCRYNLL
ncbi:hypothetical protein GGS21DRAFT_530999 [Xylaria nigripes]|nr:hypothetical protein GGS21DRAFT_530999 [Xylaria nigripes]